MYTGTLQQGGVTTRDSGLTRRVPRGTAEALVIEGKSEIENVATKILGEGRETVWLLGQKNKKKIPNGAKKLFMLLLSISRKLRHEGEV